MFLIKSFFNDREFSAKVHEVSRMEISFIFQFHRHHNQQFPKMRITFKYKRFSKNLESKQEFRALIQQILRILEKQMKFLLNEKKNDVKSFYSTSIVFQFSHLLQSLTQVRVQFAYILPLALRSSSKHNLVFAYGTSIFLSPSTKHKQLLHILHTIVIISIYLKSQNAPTLVYSTPYRVKFQKSKLVNRKGKKYIAVLLRCSTYMANYHT